MEGLITSNAQTYKTKAENAKNIRLKMLNRFWVKMNLLKYYLPTKNLNLSLIKKQ